MRPLTAYEAENAPMSTEQEAVAAALAWHDGDALATIATLLADCAHLRRQIALSRFAMGRGFTRGWEPTGQRE